MDTVFCNGCHEDIPDQTELAHMKVCAKTFCLLCQTAFKEGDEKAGNNYIHEVCMNNLSAFPDKVREVKVPKNMPHPKDGDIIVMSDEEMEALTNPQRLN